MSQTNDRWKPNVVVAAVIQGGDGRFLLVEEETPDGLKLNNPAGHLDPGESPEQGVIREVLEETTCAFTPKAFVGVYLSRFKHPTRGNDVTFMRLAFSGTVGAPDPKLTLDEGIVRTVWMSEQEIRASVDRHRSPMVIRCLDDYLAGRAYPLELITTDPSVFKPEL